MGQQIQTALPAQDDFAGGGTPTPVANNTQGGSSVSSSVNPQGDACQVKLQGLAWPGPGAEVLTVGMAGDGTTIASVVLWQGDQIITAQTVTPAVAFQNYSWTLTAAQVALITDYSDLHVEVVAGAVVVPCCPNPMPEILTLTYSGGSGASACLNGVSVKLAYVGGGRWEGTVVACGYSNPVTVSCGGTLWSTYSIGQIEFANFFPDQAAGCGVGTTLITFSAPNGSVGGVPCSVSMTVTG
jgi:hypothetical protein